MIDVNTLSLKELRELQSQVTKAISTFEDRKRKAALAELDEKARSLGFTLAELTGVQATRKRTESSAKYADPANPDATWTGRGRKPGWFIAALASGKTPDDLLI